MNYMTKLFVFAGLILIPFNVYAPPPPPVFGGSGGGGILDRFGPGIYKDGKSTTDEEMTSTQSGITLVLPTGWKISQDSSNYLFLQGPVVHALGMTINLNDYGPQFPIEESIKAFRNSAQLELREGKILHFEEKLIDGVIGILRIEAPTANSDDPRRITWIGYKGQIGINIVASAKVASFEEYKEELLTVLDSVRFRF